MDDVKDWTGRKTGDLIRLAEERTTRKTTWCRIVQGRPNGRMAAGHDDDDDTQSFLP
jgi:hypothetical protein